MDSQNQFYGPGSGQSPDNGPMGYQPPIFDRGNAMATAALACGILAALLFFTFTVFPAAVLGGLSVLFAFLSRGNKPVVAGKAKIGLVLGAIALSANLIMSGYAMYRFFTDDAFYAQVDDAFRAMYGEGISEFIEDMEDGRYDGPSGGGNTPILPGGGGI